MAAWGRKIVIIATGLDMVHENTLCTQILKRGGLLLSEQPSGTKATSSRRIACARLQVALANPIVVVQAAMKSTAMRAVDFARKCGKMILAYRYDIYNDSNEGNKYLLETGIAMNVTQGCLLCRRMNFVWFVRKRRGRRNSGKGELKNSSNGPNIHSAKRYLMHSWLQTI